MRLKRVREEGLIGELLEGDVERLNGWDTHGGWYADRAKSGDWMLEKGAKATFDEMLADGRTPPLEKA